VHLIKY